MKPLLLLSLVLRPPLGLDLYTPVPGANPLTPAKIALGLDPNVRPLHLDAGEKQALIAFLQSLSGTIHEGNR
jgi:hypothetical protein